MRAVDLIRGDNLEKIFILEGNLSFISGSSATVLTRSIVPTPNYNAQSENQSALISAMENPLHFSTENQSALISAMVNPLNFSTDEMRNHGVCANRTNDERQSYSNPIVQ